MYAPFWVVQVHLLPHKGPLKGLRFPRQLGLSQSTPPLGRGLYSLGTREGRKALWAQLPLRGLQGREQGRGGLRGHHFSGGKGTGVVGDASPQTALTMPHTWSLTRRGIPPSGHPGQRLSDRASISAACFVGSQASHFRSRRWLVRKEVCVLGGEHPTGHAHRGLSSVSCRSWDFPLCCAVSAGFGPRLSSSSTSEPQWEVSGRGWGGGLSLAAMPGASQDGQ